LLVALYVAGWLAAFGITLALVVAKFAYDKKATYLKTYGLKDYRENKSHLSQFGSARLQVFLNGTQNTAKDKLLSCFSINDWRYMRDYYAGQLAVEIDIDKFIHKVKMAKSRLQCL
jgi:hypothetical protein